jgi:NAD(P)-dependent dehydrogenase (short-subunit alcohol dehydrogenase family)
VDSPEGGQAIVDASVSQFGRLDAVVSNAGRRERATGIEPATSSLGSWHTYRLRKQMAKPVPVVPHALGALEDSALFVVITR